MRFCISSLLLCPPSIIKTFGVPARLLSNLTRASRCPGGWPWCTRYLVPSRSPGRWCKSNAGGSALLANAKEGLIRKYLAREFFRPLKLDLPQVQNGKLHLQDIFVPPLLTDKPRYLETADYRGKSTQRDTTERVQPAKHYEIHNVFDGLDSAGTGKTVLILGPSGTGKTTCFTRMLPFWWGNSNYMADVDVLLLVKLRTHRSPGIVKEQTLRDLFQLDDLGLEEEEIQDLLRFIKTRDNPNDVCIIVDGLDKCTLEQDVLLRKIIEREKVGMHAYNLLITARPCEQVDDFRQEGCFDHELYLNGFSPKTRDLFLKKYVSIRHNKNWKMVKKQHIRVLNFGDFLTCLPFSTTLFGELLPKFEEMWHPRTRTDLYHKMIGHLIAQDLKRKQMEITGDVTSLPAPYKKALGLIGALALDDLCSDSPKNGFSETQLTRRLDGNETLEEEVKQLRHALTVNVAKVKEAAGEKFYKFLDSSVQDYLAAYTFTSQLETVEVPSRPMASRLEIFWLFSAGHSSQTNGLAVVFQKMMDCYSEQQKAVGVSETVMTMLVEAFSPLSKKKLETIGTNHATASILAKVSHFLEGHLYYGQRWASEIPFWCVGHAMHVLPNIEKVTVFSHHLPTGPAFSYFLKGLKCQQKSLNKVKLFARHTAILKKKDLAKMADDLVSFLKEADHVEVFRCDWQFPDDSVRQLCEKGIAESKKLWDIGLSFHSKTVNPETIEIFTKVVHGHPSLVSINIGDIDPELPKPLSKLIADPQCRVERINILVNNSSKKMIYSLAAAIRLNKSLTAVGLTRSNYHFQGDLVDSSDQHLHHVTRLACVLRKHQQIQRVIVETAAFSLGDQSFISMLKELICVDTTTKAPIEVLKVICNKAISQSAAVEFAKLVRQRNQTRWLAVSTRRQLGKPNNVHEVTGTFKENIPPWRRKYLLRIEQKQERQRQLLALAAIVAVHIAAAAVARWLLQSSKFKNNCTCVTEKRVAQLEEIGGNLSENAARYPLEMSVDKPGRNPSHQTDRQLTVRNREVTVTAPDHGSEDNQLSFSPIALLVFLQPVVTKVTSLIGSIVSYNNKKTQGAGVNSNALPGVATRDNGHRMDGSPNAQPLENTPPAVTLLSPSAQATAAESISVLSRRAVPIHGGEDNKSLHYGGVEGNSSPNTHTPGDIPSASEALSSPGPVFSPGPVPVHIEPLQLGANDHTMLFGSKSEHEEDGEGEVSIDAVPSDDTHPALEQLSSPELVLSPAPVPVHAECIPLDVNDHATLFGLEAEREEVVNRAALHSPFLPALLPHLDFFIYTLSLWELLDQLITKNVFRSSSDVYQEIVKEGLSANKRRRLLLFYMLGSLPYSAFHHFWTALQEVHGRDHKDVLLAVERGMVSECRDFLLKHCLLLKEETARQVLCQLGVDVPQSPKGVKVSTVVEWLFLTWHEKNASTTTFADLLQVMVDERVIQHPSTQVLARK